LKKFFAKKKEWEQRLDDERREIVGRLKRERQRMLSGANGFLVEHCINEEAFVCTSGGGEAQRQRRNKKPRRFAEDWSSMFLSSNIRSAGWISG